MPPDASYTYQRRLPHWRCVGATYFVTWRLCSRRTALAPREKDLVAAALRYFHRERYCLLAYVVMDEHVHALVEPFMGRPLHDILHSWKSYTAHEIARVRGSAGRVWQDESFDRVVRGARELVETLKYILDNPRRRWPAQLEYRWAWTRFAADANCRTDAHGNVRSQSSPSPSSSESKIIPAASGKTYSSR